MADEPKNSDLSACCGSCKNTHHARPRFVIGVFMDLAGANGVAEKLRSDVGRNVNVLSSSVPSSSGPTLAHRLAGQPAQSIMTCSRLYQQITHHLDSGATIVVVDAHSPEQQLGASRILLQSKCDMLLTHDGAQYAT